jgi:PAS domain S-box-containing protein
VAVDAHRVNSGLPLQQVVQDAVADFPACVLIADQSGRIVAASNLTLQTLGYTLQLIREQSVTELGGQEEEEEVELLWESFRRQRRQSGRFTLRHRNGTTIATRYAALTNVVGGFSAAVHVIDER